MIRTFLCIFQINWNFEETFMVSVAITAMQQITEFLKVCIYFQTLHILRFNYVSPSNEGRHIVLVWFIFFRFFSAKLVRTITFFVFPDRSMIFGMWVHDHKAVSRTMMTVVGPWPLTSRSNNCFFRGDISFRYLKQFFLVLFCNRVNFGTKPVK